MISIRKGSSATWEMMGDIHPKLGIVFYEFVKELARLSVNNVIITSIVRAVTGDTGVHSVGRAIDIANSFPRDLGRIAQRKINKKYPYDSKRPRLNTVVFHKTNSAGDNALHYHLQVME